MKDLKFLEKKNLFYSKIQKHIIKIYTINNIPCSTNKIIIFFTELNKYLQNSTYITYVQLENFLKLFISQYCTIDDIDEYYKLTKNHTINLIISESCNCQATFESLILNSELQYIELNKDTDHLEFLYINKNLVGKSSKDLSKDDTMFIFFLLESSNYLTIIDNNAAVEKVNQMDFELDFEYFSSIN
jgi:hypothetical protein